jgi:hypothetical protein
VLGHICTTPFPKDVLLWVKGLPVSPFTKFNTHDKPIGEVHMQRLSTSVDGIGDRVSKINKLYNFTGFAG